MVLIKGFTDGGFVMIAPNTPPSATPPRGGRATALKVLFETLDALALANRGVLSDECALTVLPQMRSAVDAAINAIVADRAAFDRSLGRAEFPECVSLHIGLFRAAVSNRTLSYERCLTGTTAGDIMNRPVLALTLRSVLRELVRFEEELKSRTKGAVGAT